MSKLLLKLSVVVFCNLCVTFSSLADVIDTTNVVVSSETKQRVKSELSNQSSAAYAAYVDWHTPSTSSSVNCDSVRGIVKMNEEKLGKGCGGFDDLIMTTTECNNQRYKRYKEEYEYAKNIGCL